MKQTPRIVASALTGSWFVVTEQMETILRYTAKAAATRAKGKRR